MAEYFYGITDKGKRRERNEDTFFTREMLNKQFLVAGVIDGVGGYKGGDVAANIARAVIIKQLESLSGNVIENLQEAIIAANAKINEEKRSGSKNERMACVLTCAVIDVKNNKCWYAHVGDTRIYLLRDQSLIKISSDHSAVGFLEESGRLSEEEAMRHPRRNEVNKALGFEEDIAAADDFIETGESPFLPGDLLLLCSDGLTDMISSAKISSILTLRKSLATRGKELVNAANDAGGDDNITAVLVEHNKQPKQQLEPVHVKKKQDATAILPGKSEDLHSQDTGSLKKNKHVGIAWLALLIVGLFVAAIAIAIKKNTPHKAVMTAKATTKTDMRFVQLISHVTDSSKKYEVTGKGTSVNVTGPITINKDSFLLNGNGAILTPASLYKGPAFIINSTAKHIVLDSVIFKDFDVGIIIQKNNITLKNVRFINCRVPVEYLILFPDSVISGGLKDSIFVNK